MYGCVQSALPTCPPNLRCNVLGMRNVQPSVHTSKTTVIMGTSAKSEAELIGNLVSTPETGTGGGDGRVGRLVWSLSLIVVYKHRIDTCTSLSTGRLVDPSHTFSSYCAYILARCHSPTRRRSDRRRQRPLITPLPLIPPASQALLSFDPHPHLSLSFVSSRIFLFHLPPNPSQLLQPHIRFASIFTHNHHSPWPRRRPPQPHPARCTSRTTRSFSPN